MLVLWFGSFGLMLTEAGLDLSTYFASATIIGLAVGFGSQGVVQDIVTGLTLVFSDLIDVGDMVEIAGRTGVVTVVGMRFVEIRTFLGATVYVPNRTITNVVSYTRGYVRAQVDVRLPDDPAMADAIEARTVIVVRGAYAQFPGLCMAAPEVEGRTRTDVDTRYLRITLRIWPGESAGLEALKAELIDTLEAMTPEFSAWMVAITLETQEKRGDLNA